MDEIDYDVNVFNQAAREADKNLAVRFYTMPFHNEVKSLEEGRPIFDDTVFIEIRVRGDRNNIIQRPAHDGDKQRFRDAYRAFQDGVKELNSGTPLAQWPIISASMVEELKYFGFYTVEQVSNADDAACSRMTGLITLRQKAKIFIEHAKGGAPIEKLVAEKNELSSRLEVAERSNKELAAQLEQLTLKFNKLAEKVAK